MVSRVGKKNATKEKGSSFKYTKRTAEDVKKRATQTGGRFDSPFKQGFDTFRPKNGENLVRILPATWEDHDHYGLDVWMHRFVGGDNSNYLCAHKMEGKRCPICEEQKLAKDAGEDDEAKALSPTKRTLVWVIDRDDKSDPPVPQIWDMSWTQDRDIAGMCHTERTGKILLIDHPDDGYDITIKKSGQGLKTKYQFIIDRESSPIDDDVNVQEEILQYITENPLPTVLRFDTPEHIEKQLSGTAESKDKDIDDDEKPRRGRGRDDDDDKPARGRRSAKDDDDEDEKPRRRRGADDDDDTEEKPRRRVRADDADDEDEKPRRRAAKDDDDDEKPRRRVAKDDDGDEEEKPRRRSRSDDDEPDEKPARRRARDDDDEEKPRRRAAKDDEPEDEPDRGARRRSRDDDEPEDKPARRRSRDDDDEPEEKPKRARERVSSADDEDEKPRSRRAAKDEDDEPEEKPRRRAAAKDDDDDERPARRRR
jgi:hypothetical protein